MTCRAPLVVVLLMATVQLNAQESRITKLVVEKKAGRVDGKAMATALGPVGKRGYLRNRRRRAVSQTMQCRRGP